MPVDPRMNRRQFPLGDTPGPVKKFIDPKNDDYHNDVVLSHIAAMDPGPLTKDDYPSFARSLSGGRVDHGVPAYYPGGQGQGKLFHDPKPTAEHRWPRGYDPQRQGEVRDVLDRTTGNDPLATERVKWAQDTMARSSADIEPLGWDAGGGKRKGRNILDVTDDVDRADYLAADKLGYYDSQSQKVSVNRALSDRPHHENIDYQKRYPQATVDVPGLQAGRVLMHELGHAASAAAGTNFYGTPATRGTEEGRADIYAHLHHVPRKDEAQGREADYRPGRQQASGLVEQREFHDAYRAEHHRQGLQSPSERRDAAQGVEARRRDAEQRASWIQPGQHHEGQDRLWQRQAESSVTNRERDYGQHPIRAWHQDYGGEALGTITSGAGVPSQPLRDRRVSAREARLRRNET